MKSYRSVCRSSIDESLFFKSIGDVFGDNTIARGGAVTVRN
jgi:hypothetical protein